MPSLSYTLNELSRLTHTRLVGEPEHRIMGVADLASAAPSDASFLANEKYLSAMQQSKAGVVFIAPTDQPIEGRNFLIAENPSLAFQQVIALFKGHHASGFSGVHPTAVVHPGVSLGQKVTVGPYAVIDQGAVIGDETVIGAGVFIGAATVIGPKCHLHAHAVVREGCVLGARVILQPGAVIGSCGYGYTLDEKGRHMKLEQLGNVVLEDDVEIGANTTIDRARFKETRIGQGTKIDNLVQIGHGVVVGKHNLLVSQVGVAGSTKTGDYVVLGGKVAVNGHISIASGVQVAACSGISKSIDEAGVYNGVPVMTHKAYNRQQVYLRNIEKYVKRIEALEKKLSNASDNIKTESTS